MQAKTFYILQCCLITCALLTISLVFWGEWSSVRFRLQILDVVVTGGMSLGGYAIVKRGLFLAPRAFMNFVMGSMLGRMFLSIIFVFTVALIVKPDLYFASTFFLSYFLFTGFEIYALMNNLRENYKGGKPPQV